MAQQRSERQVPCSPSSMRTVLPDVCQIIDQRIGVVRVCSVIEGIPARRRIVRTSHREGSIATALPACGVHRHYSADFGEHADQIRRWYLGDINARVALEHCHIGGLPAPGYYPREMRHGPGAERAAGRLSQSDHPGTECVALRRLLSNVSVVDQRTQQAMNGRHREAGEPCQFGEAAGATIVCQML